MARTHQFFRARGTVDYIARSSVEQMCIVMNIIYGVSALLEPIIFIEEIFTMDKAMIELSRIAAVFPSSACLRI
jgi:hypothetical protein